MDGTLLRLKSNLKMTDLTCVIPCYNESPDIVKDLYGNLMSLGCRVIVVNDGGERNIPSYINKIEYSPNRGYGHAIKTGISAAVTPYVCLLDGDGQHTPEDVIKLYAVMCMVKDCDMVVGCRWNLKEKSHRWMGRKVLNFIASVMAGHYLVDLNSGMRVIKRESIIGYFPILCDVFSFTTSCTMSMVADRKKVVYIPIDVRPRAFGSSRVRVVRDGIITLSYILKIGFAMRTRGIRSWLRKLLGR